MEAMSELDLRTIRPDDYPRVGRLLLAAYDDAGPFDDAYRDFLRDPDRWVPGTTETFVAEHAGTVVGVVGFVLPGDAEFETVRPPAGDAGFRFLAVDLEARGLGAGAALTQRCITEATARGCHRMVIHSMAFMTAAHALYLRLGFVRRPDLDVRFPSGIGIAFARDLTADAPAHFPAPGPVPDQPPWYEQVMAFDDAPATPRC